MNNINEIIRGFIQISKTKNGSLDLKESGDIDQVLFGLYYPNGGTQGEMSMLWRKIGKNIVPQLKVFNDAWFVLAQFNDLISLLSKHNNEDISSDEFCKLLLQCGFEDLTTKQQNPSCYLSNKNTLPLCTGKESKIEECNHCSLYENMIEPYDNV